MDKLKKGFLTYNKFYARNQIFEETDLMVKLGGARSVLEERIVFHESQVDDPMEVHGHLL